ncbi:MAG: 30S ribosomal protein S17 [Candidatus Micrarchaeia archaeon]
MSKEKECTDAKCPKHGKLKTRGMAFAGKVVSAKGKKSAVVQIDYFRKVPKYERLEKRRSRIRVYVPECVKLKDGQTITIAECRKISKTKSHVVTQ